MKKISLSLMFSLSLLMFSGSLLASLDRPSPTTPGNYSRWGGEIDKLVIVAPFKLADYNRIVVEPFHTSSTPLPNEQDSTYAAVKSALDHTTPVIAAMLSSVLPKTPPQVQEPGASPNDAGALVIRGKVLTMEPGSLIPVYSPNGPGRARTVIACEVVDGITGKTLLRFQQERRVGPSGGSAETFGPHTQVNVSLRPGPTGSSGDLYEKALAFNLRYIGRDLADVLKSF